ncbi:MAG: GNAT family N-acetyltransferase [Actinobacteria bacterium]|nr:GNAT family N-acetyltransferase [Actinomycetota bacterium]MCL6096048.1 GNAT family N-acetyltransferase [Actinomycetota bacterium]
MVGISHLEVPLKLHGRRVELRTLTVADYEAWHEVRVRCRDWLVPWEPRTYGEVLPEEDRASFAYRCQARERERQLGTGYGFGIFLFGTFVGEISLSSIQRGPFQSAMIGYWIDKQVAGRGLMPEAVVTVMSFAFEELGLHRLEIAIVPRNRASRRVMEKLGLREEGIALRYLEIDGRWEDHVRYAITVEEWVERREDYRAKWL